MLQRRGVVAGCGALALSAMTRRAATAASGQVLFSQPALWNGVAPNLGVAGVVPNYQPTGVFYMRANQPNPFTPNSDFVPLPWDAGSFTGLHVPTPGSLWQRGMWNPAAHSGIGHTVAQAYGPTVGAFLNSADLVDGSPGNRMMISPTYSFANTVTPFSWSGARVGLSFNLLVPTASAENIGGLSNAYIKLDMLFNDTTNNSNGRMSFSCNVFAYDSTPKSDGAGFDPLTFTAIADALVSPLGKLVTLTHGSAVFSPNPWSSWANFSFTISYAQFRQATIYANSQAILNGYSLSPNPEAYVLNDIHLNAEMHYTFTLPSTLGWSMQNLTLTQLS